MMKRIALASGASFHFEGLYRVQSRKTPVPSGLSGTWMIPGGEDLDSAKVNAALHRNPLWQGSSTVGLRVAWVRKRSGAFALEADALYYKEMFTADGSGQGLLSDILDLSKLVDHWNEREPYNSRVFGPEVLGEMVTLVGDVQRAASNEYHCHEAGHAVGWDVSSKYREGYFSVQGRTAWPLIFVEEFRADLHAMAFALELLPLNDAVAVFLYHLLHRFGLAAWSLQNHGSGAGMVPYLLFCVLRDQGFARLGEDRRLHLRSLTPADLAEVMRRCGDHARRELTETEAEPRQAIDVALQGAAYFRRRLLEEEALAEYEACFSMPA